ncbi:hypothetical protein TNCV_1814781 [Trichonephila clavipes]|nr:hypothetical protein TNCV_1814781 [Trichonephila clavipes]
MGLGSRRPTIVPLLNARHQAAHLVWAREHRNWNVGTGKESPDVNLVGHLWDGLEQGVKNHHTALTNLTELWAALANILQVIPLDRFQKYGESRTDIIRDRGGPTRY